MELTFGTKATTRFWWLGKMITCTTTDGVYLVLKYVLWMTWDQSSSLFPRYAMRLERELVFVICMST